jgi:hypothetical protein
MGWVAALSGRRRRAVWIAVILEDFDEPDLMQVKRGDAFEKRAD